MVVILLVGLVFDEKVMKRFRLDGIVSFTRAADVGMQREPFVLALPGFVKTKRIESAQQRAMLVDFA